MITPESEFPTANLSADVVQRIKKLEQDLRNETKENIVLIAYHEDEQQHDSDYVFPYWE